MSFVTVYLACTVVFAAMVMFSGTLKIWRDPRTVQIIHEGLGVSLKVFPFLAGCEYVGAVGLVLGIRWPLLGVWAAVFLVLYFVGATLSHLRAGDIKNIGPAAFMLVAAAVVLGLRLHLGPHPHWIKI